LAGRINKMLANPNGLMMRDRKKYCSPDFERNCGLVSAGKTAYTKWSLRGNFKSSRCMRDKLAI